MEQESQALTIIEQAKGIQVIDTQSRNMAAAFIVTAKGVLKSIKAYHKEVTEAAYTTWKKAKKQESDECSPIEVAITHVIGQISSFDMAEKAKRIAEEMRLLEEANRKREAIEKQIKKAAEKNDLEKVEELQDRAAAIVDPSLNQSPKTIKIGDGSFSAREDIDVEVGDLKTLVEAVAKGIIPITVIDVKLTTLKSWIKSSGLEHAPGVIIRKVNAYTTRTGGGQI